MADSGDRRIWEILDYARDHWKPKPGPVVLSQEYLDFLQRVEALPQNRPGADKSWVERIEDGWDEHFARARLLEKTGEGLPSPGAGPPCAAPPPPEP